MSVTGPLSGLRVLELGSFIAGPFAAQLLADLGAEVLKVEPPGGDSLRTWGAMASTGSSWWSYVQNRGKKLACLDLKYPEAPPIIRRALANVDVLIENFRPDTIERWGLGPEQVAAEFPHLVYVAISGYGLTGPNRSLPGFGNVAESRGGLRYVTGYPDRPPVRTGVSLGDAAASLYAVVGALASLYARGRSNSRSGEVVDVALTDAVFSLTEAAITEYLHAGVVRERTGNQLLRAAPSNVYLTADHRWLALGGNSQDLFRRLTEAMGMPHLASDPRFTDNQARVAHVAELDEIIGDWTARHTLDELLRLTSQARIPAGPVQSMVDIAGDPQFRERDVIITVSDPDNPSLGDIAVPGPVPKFRTRQHRPTTTGGPVGRDTALLAEWAGVGAAEYQKLLDAGVLVDAHRLSE